MKEIRVSSSWTLFYKLFIPTSWIAFFGSMTVFIVFANGMGAVSAHLFVKLGILFFFLTGFAFLWFTLMRFMRVEMAEDGFYVTNYFKTFKYTYDSIRDIKEYDIFIMKLCVFKFTEKSSFGKSIIFVERRKVWADFVATHPQLFSHVL